MPPSAVSKVPLRSETAPVKAPFTWPNISLSTSSAGTAAQFIWTKALSRRGDSAWIARATSSLPVPALARDQHPRSRRRHHVHELVDALHGVRAADHAVARPVGALLPGAALARRHRRERAVEHVVEPLASDRLLEVLGRAEPHRLDRVRDAAVAGHDHDRRHRRAPLQLAQHVEAGPVGQLQVEQHRRRSLLPEDPQPLADRRRPERPVAARREHVEADLAKRVVVVDHEDERAVGDTHRGGGCYHRVP